MTRPTILILVDGVMQRREAYLEHELIDVTTMRSPKPEWMPRRVKPVLRDNEHLREAIDGYMEIVTFPKPL